MLQKIFDLEKSIIQKFSIDDNIITFVDITGNICQIDASPDEIDLKISIKKKFLTSGGVIEIIDFDEENLMIADDKGKIHFVSKKNCK